MTMSENGVVRKVPLFSYKLSDYAKGFLEAAIDGEGSIMLIKSKRPDRKTGRVWQPVVKVTNKSHKWLELVAELASGGRIDRISSNWKKKHYKGFVYVMPRSIIRRVLPQLGFIIKERQRVLLLEALEILASHTKGIVSRSPLKFTVDDIRLEAIKREINYLNRKGEPVE